MRDTQGEQERMRVSTETKKDSIEQNKENLTESWVRRESGASELEPDLNQALQGEYLLSIVVGSVILKSLEPWDGAMDFY